METMLPLSPIYIIALYVWTFINHLLTLICPSVFMHLAHLSTSWCPSDMYIKLHLSRELEASGSILVDIERYGICCIRS